VGDEQCGRRDSQRERIGHGRRGRLGHDHRDERREERDVRRDGDERAGGLGGPWLRRL